MVRRAMGNRSSDDELQQTLTRYRAHRAAADEGREGWEELSQFFTDDAVLIDPAWGRVEGLDAIRTFLADSMVGLDDWTFPVDFIAVDGDRVIVKRRQVVPGTKPDGSRYEQSGWSLMLYAGGGKFSYEEDVFNMVHLREDLVASGWKPPAESNRPPAKIDRNFAPSRTAT
jgi:limonene-1,2-epoxide hydrolase